MACGIGGKGKDGMTKLLTIDQLCERWNVLPGWVYRRTAKGAKDPLPSIRLRGLLRFDPAEVAAWEERNHRRPA
jgi:hypothetical protein